MNTIREIEIHTTEEVAAEVKVLRIDVDEVRRLLHIGVLRPWCFEEDLRIEAYNRLTLKRLLK